MNANHTPGPWSIRDDDEDGVVSIVGNSKIVLALVRTATVEPGDANARLIAAAPELLEALEPFGAIDLIESRLPAEFAMLVLRARAAIAKATGA